jgi:ABC-type multidrug transport system permease subunit
MSVQAEENYGKFQWFLELLASTYVSNTLIIIYSLLTGFAE